MKLSLFVILLSSTLIFAYQLDDVNDLAETHQNNINDVADTQQNDIELVNDDDDRDVKDEQNDEDEDEDETYGDLKDSLVDETINENALLQDEDLRQIKKNDPLLFKRIFRRVGRVVRRVVRKVRVRGVIRRVGRVIRRFKLKCFLKCAGYYACIKKTVNPFLCRFVKRGCRCIPFRG